MTIKEPDQSVWNRFWKRKNDMNKVYPSSPSVLEAIKKNFNPAGMKILEVGAGTGRDSAELARMGAQVYVLDFAENSLKIVDGLRAKDNLYESLKLVRGDAFKAPFPDNTFDLVFHQGLAEHFKDSLPLIKENFRILKHGGHCLCDVPQTVHPYTVIKHILIAMDKWFAGWEKQFTMPQLKKLMADAGFECVYQYGDWMRPNLFYRMAREFCFKFGVELPKYPLQGTAYQKAKDRILNSLESNPLMHYTQLSIGVLGRKP
ncbi:MAG: class I SAM-dependent methyltransferase [Fibrobacter sp.]|nr:class I SAM-dependent methyltransferase [Fibrobacter sp.]